MAPMGGSGPTAVAARTATTRAAPGSTAKWSRAWATAPTGPIASTFASSDPSREKTRGAATGPLMQDDPAKPRERPVAGTLPEVAPYEAAHSHYRRDSGAASRTGT